MTTISIALATYNGERFIAEQLESLRTQSRLPDELVVGDDGSTDRTLAIIQQFAQSAPFPVRFSVNKAQLGYKRNFVGVAERCQGDLVAFCDQDDLWYPEKIAQVVECMAAPNVVLCYHDYDVIGRDGTILQDNHSQAHLQKRSSLGAALGLTQAFRKSLLRLSDAFEFSRDQNRPDEVMAHDQWFHFVARCSGDIGHIPRALLGYRQHGANVCGQVQNDPQTERRLGANVAILPGRLMGHRSEFEEKRQLLQTDLDWQRFSLVHRIELIARLAASLSDQRRAADLREVYRRQLEFIDERLLFYASETWTKRLAAFPRAVGHDLQTRTLQKRFKKRLLDLAYGVARSKMS